jgi:hypothetical protein
MNVLNYINNLVNEKRNTTTKLISVNCLKEINHPTPMVETKIYLNENTNQADIDYKINILPSDNTDRYLSTNNSE